MRKSAVPCFFVLQIFVKTLTRKNTTLEVESSDDTNHNAEDEMQDDKVLSFPTVLNTWGAGEKLAYFLHFLIF